MPKVRTICGNSPGPHLSCQSGFLHSYLELSNSYDLRSVARLQKAPIGMGRRCNTVVFVGLRK